MDQGSLLKVHTSFVRSVLEYTVPVWQSIPGYLSDKIESIQKRALKIIFPCADSYSDALELAWVETLAYRRDEICKEYMCKTKDLNHPLHPLLTTRLDDTCPYTLGHKSDQLYFYRNLLPVEQSAPKTFSLLSIFNKWDTCSVVVYIICTQYIQKCTLLILLSCDITC